MDTTLVFKNLKNLIKNSLSFKAVHLINKLINK